MLFLRLIAEEAHTMNINILWAEKHHAVAILFIFATEIAVLVLFVLLLELLSCL